MPLFDSEAATFLNEVYERAAPQWADTPRRHRRGRSFTCPVVIGQGTRLFRATGPDAAIDLVDSRATPAPSR